MADELVLAAAREAYGAGLCVVPPAEDGSKRPLSAWKDYQTERPSPDTMREWYGPCAGVGLVCGSVSGNLEVLDFDTREAYEAFAELAHQAELGGLLEALELGYSEDSPNGVHLFYRCSEIAGNVKLASRSGKTWIETRGEGGYVIVAPSNGRIHPSGLPYVRRAGSLKSILMLLPEERHELHQLARALDESEPPAEVRRKATETHRGNRPGDDYNARAEWADVLEPHGWRAVYTRQDTTYWRRPGKAYGVSATTNYGGSDLLIVFSTSTLFDANRGYAKFSAYTVLNHAGDFSAAALALSQLGYGAPVSGASTPHAEAPAVDETWAPRLPVLAASLAQRPVVPPLIHDFLPGDGITLLHSQPREWKTLITKHVHLALATGRPLFGLSRLAVPERKRTLYVSEEDSKPRVLDRFKLIAAGLEVDLPDEIFVAAGNGLSLDDPGWQQRLVDFVRAEAIAAVSLDPLRALSACVDQGPKELRPLAVFLRRLMRETGCAVFGVHHDAKPIPGVADLRRAPQRASGGAIFSIADQPIAVEPLPDGRRVLRPAGWKFAADPVPVALTLECGDDWLRLVGQDADGATSTRDGALAERVLAFLAEHSNSSTRHVAEGVKGRRERVTAVLKELATTGQVDSVESGNAVLWFLIGPWPGSHAEP